MNYNKSKVGILFLMSFFAVGLLHSLFARDISVSSERKFYNRVMRNRLAVVMFYREDDVMKQDPLLQQKIDNLENIFESLSKVGRYQEGDLVFLKANISRGDLDELSNEFGVKELPAFLLFRNGVAIRDMDTKKAVMWVPALGEVTDRGLSAFIAQHLDKDIDRNIRKRAKRLRSRRYYYGGPYFYGGWGYPYYGYGPYYGRPYGGGYVGFGIGF